MPARTNMIAFCVVLGLALIVLLGVGIGFKGPVDRHDVGGALLQVAGLVAVWVLLAVLLFMGSGSPKWAVVLAWILHPASLAAAIAVLDQKDNLTGSSRWLLAVPMVAPLAIAAFASWVYFPAFRAAVPVGAMGGGAWGLVFILAVAPWIAMMQHDAEIDAGRAEAAKEYLASEAARNRPESLLKLQSMTDDTPLWAWRELAAPEKGVREETFAAIRKLKRRQSDAEYMIANGAPGVLVDLPNLDLELTPAIIAGHKKYVRDLATGNQRPDAGKVEYSWISSQIDAYLPTIQYMAEKHCGCASEVAALEATIRSYKNSPGRAECLAALKKAQMTEQGR